MAQPQKGASVTQPQHHPIYQIILQGHLSANWTDWFENLTITEHNGNTHLTGPIIDQAALHSVLKKIRNLGMPLISVTRVD